MQTFDLPEPQIAAQSLGFSPDGRLLAAWAFGKVFLVDAVAGTTRALWAVGDRYGLGCPGVGFTADGTGVVVLHLPHERRPDALVQTHDTITGRTRDEFTDRRVTTVAPGVDGVVYVAFTGREVQVIGWNPLTGAEFAAFGGRQGAVHLLDVAADGRWAVESQADTVRLWAINSGEPPAAPIRLFRAGRGAKVHTLAVSAGGGFVTTAVKDIRVWEMQTMRSTVVCPTSGVGRGVAFHPGQPILAFTGGTDEVTFYDAVARAEVKRFAWGVGKLSAVAFSSDGLRCAAAGEGKVVVWDVDG